MINVNDVVQVALDVRSGKSEKSGKEWQAYEVTLVLADGQMIDTLIFPPRTSSLEGKRVIG